MRCSQVKNVLECCQIVVRKCMTVPRLGGAVINLPGLKSPVKFFKRSIETFIEFTKSKFSLVF